MAAASVSSLLYTLITTLISGWFVIIYQPCRNVEDRYFKPGIPRSGPVSSHHVVPGKIIPCFRTDRTIF